MTPPRGDAEARRAAILDAALRMFGQYGFRRTSMDDIAREAQIGKGTIYLSFASKEEVFQALSQRLVQQMLAGAEAASRQPGTTADKLAAMHVAWFGTFADTLRRSPHAADLLDAKHQLSADLVADAASRYKRLVQNVLTEAAATGELDLNSAGLTPGTAAELLIASTRGLQPSTPAAYRRHLTTLVRVMIAGLTSRHPAADRLPQLSALKRALDAPLGGATQVQAPGTPGSGCPASALSVQKMVVSESGPAE
ncbi:MAG TPA: TetR/AcrR family transcriptional regulator [Streptosporangiaceae bacterium]|jgi:AcrR family transcriptional regulator|nr:TetR/AcrR family transcriptional regulator [Streptosporangiaceae bacterium]